MPTLSPAGIEVVPVLDLMDGRAVHARRGERERYVAVDGVLGHGRDPVALAAAYRDTLGCHTIYVADLDAIAGKRRRRPLLRALADVAGELLVDAGARTPAAAEALLDAGAGAVVVGLERLQRLSQLAAIVHSAGAERVVFSLDLRRGRPLAASPGLAAMEPTSLAEAAVACGVSRLIVLEMTGVGAEAGPPLDVVRRLRRAVPEVALLAGGGVRDARDLEALGDAGCAGALVATALHAGRVTREHVRRLAEPRARA